MRLEKHKTNTELHSNKHKNQNVPVIRTTFQLPFQRWLDLALGLLRVYSFLENNSFDFSNLRNYYLKILNSNSGNSAYYNRDRDKNSIYLNPSEVVSLEYFNIKLLEMEFLVGDDVKLGNKYDDTWYDSLPWYKKLHPFVEEFEILTAVNFIVEFYIDIKKFNFS